MKRLFGTIILILVAFGCGIYLARDAFHQARVQQDAEMAARIRMNQDESARTTLLQQQVSQQSEAGRERLARERGYVRQGETPIPLSPAAAESSQTPTGSKGFDIAAKGSNAGESSQAPAGSKGSPSQTAPTASSTGTK